MNLCAWTLNKYNKLMQMTESEKKAYFEAKAKRQAEREAKRRAKYGDKYDEMMEKHQLLVYVYVI